MAKRKNGFSKKQRKKITKKETKQGKCLIEAIKAEAEKHDDIGSFSVAIHVNRNTGDQYYATAGEVVLNPDALAPSDQPDTFGKRLLLNVDNLKDCLRSIGTFKGLDFSQPIDIHPANNDLIMKVSRNPGIHLMHVIGDNIFVGTVGGNPCTLIVELKSTPDYDTALQVDTQETAYLNMVKEQILGKRHSTHLTRADRLPVVAKIVLYAGEETWDAPRKVEQLQAAWNGCMIVSDPDTDAYILIDTFHMTDDEADRFCGDVGLGIRLIRAGSKDEALFERMCNENREAIRKWNVELSDFVSFYTDISEYLKNEEATRDDKEENSMCRGLDYMRESLKVQLKPVVRDEIWDDVKAEAENAVRAEVKDELRAEVRDEVKDEEMLNGKFLAIAEAVRNDYLSEGSASAMLGVSVESFWAKVEQIEKDLMERRAKNEKILS